MTDRPDLQIHLLGDLKLLSRGRALALPPSKKTRPAGFPRCYRSTTPTGEFV